jgi:hypothetical protein
MLQGLRYTGRCNISPWALTFHEILFAVIDKRVRSIYLHFHTKPSRGRGAQHDFYTTRAVPPGSEWPCYGGYRRKGDLASLSKGN